MRLITEFLLVAMLCSLKSKAFPTLQSLRNQNLPRAALFSSKVLSFSPQQRIQRSTKLVTRHPAAFQRNNPAFFRLTMSKQNGIQELSAAAKEEARAAYNEQMEKHVVPHRIDTYNGVIIDPAGLSEAPNEFKNNLEASLEEWIADSRKGVWLKIPLSRSVLVPVAAGLGFEFHHAERDYVMMTRWLPTDLPNTLPESATHQVGVGAFVMNDNNEILAVKEHSGPAAVFDIWKVPTGLIHRGEHLGEAAVREVAEETGVRAAFDRVLTFRHAHGFSFGVSDLFFVVKMHPETFELSAQESEIRDLRWMPIQEYIAQDHYKASPLHSMINEILIGSIEGKYQGIEGSALESAIRPGDSRAPKINMLYHCNL